jgi:hypothetical protein
MDWQRNLKMPMGTDSALWQLAQASENRLAVVRVH